MLSTQTGLFSCRSQEHVGGRSKCDACPMLMYNTVLCACILLACTCPPKPPHRDARASSLQAAVGDNVRGAGANCPVYVRRVEMAQRTSLMHYQPGGPRTFLKVVTLLPSHVATARSARPGSLCPPRTRLSPSAQRALSAACAPLGDTTSRVRA